MPKKDKANKGKKKGHLKREAKQRERLEVAGDFEFGDNKLSVTFDYDFEDSALLDAIQLQYANVLASFDDDGMTEEEAVDAFADAMIAIGNGTKQLLQQYA